ncbi:MAG: hypothetical protein HYW23_02720 [Candidatus Aenigmarchaeota archaeon]|nr:hypothetical protein [Candidatus Aenigmarchaeota archaeon]
MKKLETMKAVYSYFFPEVRRLVHMSDKLPDKLFLISTPVEEAREMIASLFRTPLDLTATADGKVDLDMVHEPVIDRIISAYGTAIPRLKDFSYRYPTSGSSEGIFKNLAMLKVGGVDWIYVLEGEYEGYKEYGKTLGIRTIEINPQKTDVRKLKPGIWFISNPSAHDGNILPDNFVGEICDSGNKVYLDLAYVGSTRDYTFDVSHDNIPAVFLSFSKPYGVFRFRIGFTFSRAEIPSLYGNKWFKDIPRLFTALRLAEDIGPSKLYRSYRHVQESVIEHINEDFGLCMKTSDAVLLGNLTLDSARKLDPYQLKMIAPFQRGEGYRFCLTPYFEKVEMKILKGP